MSGIRPTLSPPPRVMANDVEHRRQLASSIQRLYLGAETIDVTLTANAGSTTINDSRIGYYSMFVFMPQTANAVVALPTMYVAQATQMKGQAVITHLNNTYTDKNFRMLIIG